MTKLRYSFSISAIPLGLALLVMAATSQVPSAYGWTKNLHFNDGEPGTKAIGSDGFSSATTGIYDTDQSFEGGQSALLSVKKGSTAWGSWGGVISFPELLREGDEVWFRVRTFMPEGFNYDAPGEGGRLKFLRVHTRSAEKSNQGYNDWYISGADSAEVFRFIFEGEQRWSSFGEFKDKPETGKWETYEMYLKLSPVSVVDGGEAIVRVWKNGLLLDEIRDRKTLVSSDSYADRAHLFTYWNGGSPETQSMWVDAGVITTETPSARDAEGNPFIGSGDVLKAPLPPRNLRAIVRELLD